MIKYITLSSMILVSICYGTESDLDLLGDAVKARVIRVQEEFKSKVDDTINSIIAAKNLSQDAGNGVLLNLVHLGCSEIQYELNKDFRAKESSGFWSWSQKPSLEYTDQHCEIIINYMYGLLDGYIPSDDQARKISIQKSLETFKRCCYGYRRNDPAILEIRKEIYLDQMARNVFLVITIGILGFSLYQKYKEYKANVQNNE